MDRWGMKQVGVGDGKQRGEKERGGEEIIRKGSERGENDGTQRGKWSGVDGYRRGEEGGEAGQRVYKMEHPNKCLPAQRQTDRQSDGQNTLRMAAAAAGQLELDVACTRDVSRDMKPQKNKATFLVAAL